MIATRKYGKLIAVKTTIDIPDALLPDIKRYAAEHGIPMRAVFERGVRQLLEGRPPTGFKLRTIPFRGKRIAGRDWEQNRALVYKNQGA